MSDEQLKAAHDLLKRLPTKDLKQNLEFLIHLNEDLTDRLLEEVEQPLVVKRCPVSSKDFLCSEYNRDGDSYRSPWSNQYVPPNPEGILPPERLRTLEVAANDTFAAFADAYYDAATTSCYFWETGGDESSDFACAIQIRKALPQSASGAGLWESQHIVTVNQLSSAGSTGASRYRYRVDSTVSIWLETEASGTATGGRFLLAGTQARSRTTDGVASDASGHIANIGGVIQSVENSMHESISAVHFGKAVEVVNVLRSKSSASVRAGQAGVAAELAGKLKARQ